MGRDWIIRSQVDSQELEYARIREESWNSMKQAAADERAKAVSSLQLRMNSKTEHVPASDLDAIATWRRIFLSLRYMANQSPVQTDQDREN